MENNYHKRICRVVFTLVCYTYIYIFAYRKKHDVFGRFGVEFKNIFVRSYATMCAVFARDFRGSPETRALIRTVTSRFL